MCMLLISNAYIYSLPILKRTITTVFFKFLSYCNFEFVGWPSHFLAFSPKVSKSIFNKPEKPVHGLFEWLSRWPSHSQTWKIWLDWYPLKTLYVTAKKQSTAMPKLIRDPLSMYICKTLSFKAILSQNSKIWIRNQKLYFILLEAAWKALYLTQILYH